MKNYFTTGQFAKLANVSERTIRYYDKEGLLKPSFIMENGYRKYSEEDFVKLQRIISLKQLGFSLDEIKAMNQNDDIDEFKKSLALQINLLDKKIKHTQMLKDALHQTQKIMNSQNKEIDWNRIVELIKMSQQDEKIVEHYRNANNLSIRIQLHEQYSLNKQGWFPWIFSNLDFSKVNRLLEVGCGSGDLWKNRLLNLRNREIFLTDISEGMLETARKKLGEEYNYMVIDADHVPFKNEYFDAVIANHMLFYLRSASEGIKEIARVIKKGGAFYCSTYGKEHMKEINALVKEFDHKIVLSDQNLFASFGLENGETLLKKHFIDVDMKLYEDELVITEVKPLLEYIMSCHGNQVELLSDRMKEFSNYLNDKLLTEGSFHITKKAGLFICVK